jgi:proline iminopeptidase
MAPSLRARATSVITLLVLWFGSACANSGSLPGLENGRFQAPVDGRTIEYEVHGKGPVVMTVPNSWGLSLEGLRAMYRPLEEELTIVYFNPRGMGASGPVQEERDLGPDAVREDFHALRKHLGLDKVTAIGWSNGAANLIVLAAESPGAIENAVFLHGNASLLPEDVKRIVDGYPDLMAAFQKFGEEMKDSALTEEDRNLRVKAFDTEVWFPFLFAVRDSAKPKLAELFRDARFSWAHAEYTNRVWASPDFRDRLPRITARSLVVAGRHDMLPPERVREIADGIEGAEFVVFEESGHFAPVEEPEKFVTTVVAFLRKPRQETP